MIIMLLDLDEFETLCGNRKKGFKIVDTLTGPRVQGMYTSLKLIGSNLGLTLQWSHISDGYKLLVTESTARTSMARERL